MDRNDTHEIHGTVKGHGGETLRQARVVVWWQRIRDRAELAAGETSEDGHYHLSYRIPENAPEPALLLVEARSEYLDEPLLSTLTQARPYLQIDLSYEPPDQSEWATLLRSIEPLLDGVTLAELVENSTHQDISFLARELSTTTETIMRIAVSARLDATFHIPAPGFYAFLRQRAPAALPSPLLDASQSFTLIDPLVQSIGSRIFALSAQTQTQTLAAAVATDLIGPQYTSQIPEIVTSLQALRATDLLSEPYFVGSTTLGQLLDVAGLEATQQTAFANALATNTQSMRNFWRNLGSQPGLTPVTALTIERTLSIGAFVKNFTPLVQNLLEGFTAGTYTSLLDLARLTIQDWINLVNQTGAPPGIDATATATAAQVFASVIYARVTRAYPTAALSSRISSGKFVPDAYQRPLLAFFQNNPKLELVKDNIPAYLAANPDALGGIAGSDQARVVAYARSFQRILRVSPDPDVAETLLSLGLTSAMQINAMGEQPFFLKATAAGLTKPEANQAFQAAAQRYASLISLYMQMNTGSIGILPRGIGGTKGITGDTGPATKQDPTLTTLFGSQDYCQTNDCTSVRSPAPYLCDLLLWLRTHQQGTQTVLDVLDSRRPDIRHLLLNCPNSDTELPYEDLVIELLADAISPAIDSIATSYVQTGLPDGTTHYYIVTAVNAVGEGTPSAQVSAEPMAPTAIPAPPTGVSTAAGDGRVTLTWAPEADAASYNVYWSTTPGVTPAHGTKVPGVSAPYTQSGLVNGIHYYYVVTAVNALGESGPSAQAVGSPAAPTAIPAAPTGVVATAGDTQVTISWDPVVNATSYNVYWSTSSGVTPASSAALPTNSASYVQAALIDGTTYYYVVTAVNALGEGAPSAEVSAMPAAATARPTAPLGVTAAAGDGEVTISWDPVAGATSYNVYWSTVSGVTPLTGTQITGGWNPKWKQTPATAAAAELSAAPAYFNQAAFAILSEADYPFSLPYSAGLDELRTCLRQLNLPLWQLRQALLPLTGATAAQQAAVAAERLGLPPYAQKLITTANFVTPQVAWNVPPSVSASEAAAWNYLAPVSTFLPTASITYESLLELLGVAWVQEGAGVGIQGLSGTCDTSTMSLAPFSPGFLDRAHRFLRLWMVSGFNMWELDLLLAAPMVGNGTLDDNALAALLAFQQLQDATRLTVNQQLAFYQNIDTATHRDPDGTMATSLYAQVFLNATVTAVAPDADLAAIPAGGPIADPTLSHHLPAIQPALGVSAANAATLFSLTDDQLTLANLSLIYRVSMLANVARLSIGNLLTIANLLTPTAGSSAAALSPVFASPAATLQFLSQVTAVRHSPLSLDAVTYLLTPPSATTLTAPITAVQTTITVASSAAFPSASFSVSIGSEILLVTAVGGPGDTTWTVTRGQQGTTAASATAGAGVHLTSGWPTTTQMTQADITNTLGDVQQAVTTLLAASTTLTASITAAQTTITVASDAGFPAPGFSVAIGSEILLITAVSGIGNTTWTVTRGQQGTTAAAAAIGASVTPTGGDVNGAAIAAVAANAHTSATQPLANDISALILQQLNVPGTPLTLLDVLTDPAFTGSASPLTPANFPRQFLAIQLFDKAAVLTRALKFVATDLGWLLGNASVYGGLDFAALPVDDSQPAIPLVSLLSTLLLVKLARLWTAAPPSSSIQTLYDVISGVSSGTLPDAAAAETALATITGWPLGNITAFASSLGPSFPVGYTQPTAYNALHTLAAMASTTQATGAQLVYWGTVPADEVAAAAMAAGALGVIKAQQGSETAWLALAPTLMNPIRDRRSPALQDYLMGQRDASGYLLYPDTDTLFDYFLIDVQMTSCMPTSRVVQAYIAVQTFVQRCLMNLEPEVAVDPNDQTWNQWDWMYSYRVWQANREVFLYPENWLIESERTNRTEIYQTFEQQVRQSQSTADYLETVVLNYIGSLDGLAHLIVTGTCEDPSTRNIYVVARTAADPPTFYLRTYTDTSGQWDGWTQITLDIKAHQAVPALYRGRICLFWLDVKTSNEPQQSSLPPAQLSSTPPPQTADRYVSLGVNFSMFVNGSWAPPQSTKGKLFDKPLYGPTATYDTTQTEALYTLKVQTPQAAPGLGASLWLDVFRLGDFPQQLNGDAIDTTSGGPDYTKATHLGRAVFDGRFSDLELRDLLVPDGILPPTSPQAGLTQGVNIYEWATIYYGPDAQSLLLLPGNEAEPDLVSDSGLVPQAGALMSPGGNGNYPPLTFQLDFTAASSLQQNVGPLLDNAAVPSRVVGPDSDLTLDPGSYFFLQDNRRCYWVEGQRNYWTGSAWAPITPSDPASAPYEVKYWFHVFYHPFTGLFWNQLAGGDFGDLYDVNLQLYADSVDSSGADQFSFQSGYSPHMPPVWWDHDDYTGLDRQFLDFSLGSAFGVYNWELFYHIPLYVAQLLSQNQQFADARAWFHYIFDPTRQSPADPVPQRYWIPKPLHLLTSAEVQLQNISSLLDKVNQGDPAEVNMVETWRSDPFNPFVLADLRPVAYMKSTVMSYLDNLIAWGDNLFSTESREALAEATLLYVTADQILGPAPVAVTPPQHADESFDQLEPALDAFANAMVEIENVIGGAGASGNTGGSNNGGVPQAQMFYFTIPSNPKLLGYWTTVADRLYKLRHCQSITGAPLVPALFDAPIDPGLLIAAQAAGVDLSSVLSDTAAALPNYRFTALYPQALDFVNAVRAYGSSLQAALEKSDAGALTLLGQTLQQQLLSDGSQILDWQVQQAQNNLDAVQQTLNLAQQKLTFNTSQDFANAGEAIGLTMSITAGVLKVIAAGTKTVAGVEAVFPNFTFGAAGFGGTPVCMTNTGGMHPATASHMAGLSLVDYADVIDLLGRAATTLGAWQRRQDTFDEAAIEAQIQIDQAKSQIAASQLALQIAQQNQVLHQEQIDDLQKQIDFLNSKFTSDSLYQWMAGSLAATHFQSYQLAYQLCKQLEICYRFELGIQNSAFIQFGYWDSLYKGLLAGESLNADLRRMQASYLQQNARRYELSRYISLASLTPDASPYPTALQQLLVTGQCGFTLPESLFDNDYPGHYNRRLTRVSVTVVYPSPGKFDNVKATLTMTANRVRVSSDTSSGYQEITNPPNGDPRFIYNYAAVPQKIALGNAQDDPGLFLTAIASNIADQRYLPFENAGAISSWHLEMTEATNEIDLSAVGDVVLHLYYTALEGGDGFEQTVKTYNQANLPTSGTKLFSALNDFAAPAPTVANPYPLTPWQSFLSPVTAPANQTLTLTISPSKFPAWTRGKTITVTSITLLTLAWPQVPFVLAPQAPLPTASVPMTPVAGTSEPYICSATITPTAGTTIGTWSFELQQQGAADFRSLNHNEIGDVLLLIDYTVSSP
jgi:fibronectin type 3 domain-containing protein